MTRDEASFKVTEAHSRATSLTADKCSSVTDDNAAFLNKLEALGLIKFDDPPPKMLRLVGKLVQRDSSGQSGIVTITEDAASDALRNAGYTVIHNYLSARG